MQVILTQDIKKLGQKDEIKKVASGYARNFLIPQKLAVLATPQAIKELERRQKVLIQKDKEKRLKAQELAQKLKELQILIKAKASPAGGLFGSISAQEIVDKVKEKTGINLQTSQIELLEPIKKVGEYPIKIKILKDLEITIKMIVERELDNKEKLKIKHETN